MRSPIIHPGKTQDVNPEDAHDEVKRVYWIGLTWQRRKGYFDTSINSSASQLHVELAGAYGIYIASN